jgi:uncharacterized protein (DUF1778 family)
VTAGGFATATKTGRTAKTRRIEMRTDPDSEGRIIQAAGLLGQSVSAFVLSAASSAADIVLARADTTVMPAEQFEDLMRSLDVADDAPRLRAAARAPWRVARA